MPRLLSDRAAGPRLIALLDEELLRLGDRHASRVHADADDEAGVAQEGVLDLREAVARIVGVKSLVDHHLLAVVCPPFAVARRAEHLSNVGREVLRIEKLQIVAGPDFVHRDVEMAA